MTDCGEASECCCTSLEVAGGTYYRTYDDLSYYGYPVLPPDGGPTDEADPASVSGLRLDKYLVTVGRFRQFVNGGRGHIPAAGTGKHAYLNSGQGLSNNGADGGFEPGWIATDDHEVAPTNANLACPNRETWTTTAGTQENLPINCVNWYEAYAFCIWDGGFLPSEAEWENAAAGGSQQRDFPWGATDPGTTNRYAIYGCNYVGAGENCDTLAAIAAVGTATLGVGRWGQLDLAGEVWEWNLDWYAPYAACTDCADATPGTARVIRGGEFDDLEAVLVPSYRNYFYPTARFYFIGFRCARSP
jgi:formylglycine-generating enzyme required for sulfatase activity